MKTTLFEPVAMATLPAQDEAERARKLQKKRDKEASLKRELAKVQAEIAELTGTPTLPELAEMAAFNRQAEKDVAENEAYRAWRKATIGS